MSKCPECDTEVLAVDAEVDPRRAALRLVAQCGHVLPGDQAKALWMGGMRWTLPVVTGASLCAAERHRQIHDEGHTAERDAELQPGDLTWAAWCLLDAAASGGAKADEVPRMWPLPPERWKAEHSPMRLRVIAMAMIAAEIDRELLASRTDTNAGS